MHEQPPIRIQLFGPITVRVDGEERPIRPLQVRRLAAALALRLGSPVLADTLIEEAWQGRRLPADPRAALRVALTRLRKILEPHHGLLVSTGGSYQLACSTDLGELEATVERLQGHADADDGAVAGSQYEAELRQAIDDMDRSGGHPLHDLGDTPLFDQQRNRCHQVRDQLVGCIGHGLSRLGAHEQVTDLLLPAHQVDPEREDVTVRLATALTRAGRKSDALAVIHNTRMALREGSGLDPSTALQEAEIAILTGDIELSTALVLGHDQEPCTSSLAPVPDPRGHQLDPAVAADGVSPQLVALLCAFQMAFDEHDWERLTTCVTDPVTVSATGPGAPSSSVRTAAQYAADHRRALEHLDVQHNHSNLVMTGSGRARCNVQIYRFSRDSDAYFHTWGRYHFDLDDTSGRLRFSAIREELLHNRGQASIVSR